MQAARPGGPIIFANAQFKVMTQYSQGDFLERNCRFLQGADTSMAVVGAIRAAVAAGEVHRTEVLNYKKDGTPFRNYLTLLPVYTTHLDGTNTLTFYIGAQFEVSGFASWMQCYPLFAPCTITVLLASTRGVCRSLTTP